MAERRALTQWLMAFLLVVGAVLLLSALLTGITEVTGLRGVDRSLGLLFGIVKEVAIWWWFWSHSPD